MSQLSRILWLGSILCVIVAGCGRREITTPIDIATRYVAEEQFAKAIAKCDEILAAEPKDYDALVMRGLAYSRSQQPNEAIADFTKAIELAPDQHDAYRWRYEVYTELAKREKDIKNRGILEQAAAADLRSLALHDPNAKDTFKKTFAEGPKYLDEPERTTEEDLQEPQLAVEDGNPFLQPANANGAEDKPKLDFGNQPKEQELGGLDDGNRRPEQAANTDTSTNPRREAPPNEDIARNGANSDEEAIEEMDLDEGELEDMKLPPHDTQMPEQRITRFDREAFQSPHPGAAPPGFVQPGGPQNAGRGANAPSRQSRRTTGISSQQPNDTAAPQGGFTPPQFSTPNQFGRTGFSPTAPRAPRTTGIRSSATNAPGSNWGTANLDGNPAMYGQATPTTPGTPAFPSPISPSPISPNAAFNQGMPTGFLPPSALGSFGPRIILQPTGAPPQGNSEANAGTPGRGLRLPRSNAGTSNPSYSTAIPGSEIIYGSQPGGRRTTAPRLTPPTRTRPTIPASGTASPLLPR